MYGQTDVEPMAEEFIPVIRMHTSQTHKVKGLRMSVPEEGMIEGVIFDEDNPTMTVQIPFNVILKRLRAGRFMSTLFNLKVDGQEEVRVICRNVQRDLVKNLPTHIELMRLRRTSRINLFISVEFIGEEKSPGLTSGGILTVVRPEVELQVTAGDIPEKIVVDLSEAKLGDTIKISSVRLPDGVKPTIDRDFVIANISSPSVLQSDVPTDIPSPQASTHEDVGDIEAISFAHLDDMIDELDAAISGSDVLINRMKGAIGGQEDK